jgi:hypothetical protein
MSMSFKFCLTMIVLAFSASTTLSQPNTAAVASAAFSNPALTSAVDNPPDRSRGRSRIKDRDPVAVLDIRPLKEVEPRPVKRGRNVRPSTSQAVPVGGWHATIGRSRRK